MPFEFYSHGVSKFFVDFTQRICSQLALEGTEIINKNELESIVEMDVRYKDELGRLQFINSDPNVKTVYTVKRRTKERALEEGAKRGAMFGAIAGIAGSILRGDKEGAIGAVGGAIGGSIWGALEGRVKATEAATDFAKLLARCIENAENEVQSFMRAQQEARATHAERRRELQEEMDEVYGEILALKEEASAKKNVLEIVKKAEKFYYESISALDNHKVSEARAKLIAAKKLTESARSKLYE